MWRMFLERTANVLRFKHFVLLLLVIKMLNTTKLNRFWMQPSADSPLKNKSTSKHSLSFTIWRVLLSINFDSMLKQNTTIWSRWEPFHECLYHRPWGSLSTSSNYSRFESFHHRDSSTNWELFVIHRLVNAGRSPEVTIHNLTQLPILLFVVNQLQSLLYDKGTPDVFFDWCLQFHFIWNTIPFPGDRKATRFIKIRKQRNRNKCSVYWLWIPFSWFRRVFQADLPFPLQLTLKYRDTRIAIGCLKDEWLKAIPNLSPRSSLDITHPTVQKWFDLGMHFLPHKR